MKKQPSPDTAPSRSVNLLSVSPAADDHISLEHIVARPEWTTYSDSKWRLHWSTSLTSALTVLRQGRTPIVICERDLPGSSWRDLLEQSAALPEPPYVIVASRRADDHLWAEALNLGAYDVLARPFDAAEVLRTVSMAWQHWQERYAA